MHPFASTGPWFLKCKLFGIHPLDHHTDSHREHVHSNSSKDMTDYWLQERIVNKGTEAYFNALFKRVIDQISEDWNHVKDIMDIIIFHRYDYPDRPGDCIRGRRRKPRYDSLNSHLIDKGVATDCNPKTGRRSHVNLDEHFVNLLAQHELLS